MLLLEIALLLGYAHGMNIQRGARGIVHHPLILFPKIIVLVVIILVLVALHGSLSPGEFAVAVALGAFVFVGFCVVLWYFVIKALRDPTSRTGRAMVLRQQERPEDGFHSAPGGVQPLAGERGVTTSALSPSGVALMGGKRMSVVTSGEFVERDTEVEVVEVHGSRIVVRQVAAQPEPEPPSALGR